MSDKEEKSEEKEEPSTSGNPNRSGGKAGKSGAYFNPDLWEDELLLMNTRGMMSHDVTKTMKTKGMFSWGATTKKEKKEDKKKDEKKKASKLTKADIGAPSGFQHVSHVGCDASSPGADLTKEIEARVDVKKAVKYKCQRSSLIDRKYISSLTPLSRRRGKPSIQGARWLLQKLRGQKQEDRVCLSSCRGRRSPEIYGCLPSRGRSPPPPLRPLGTRRRRPAPPPPAPLLTPPPVHSGGRGALLDQRRLMETKLRNAGYEDPDDDEDGKAGGAFTNDYDYESLTSRSHSFQCEPPDDLIHTPYHYLLPPRKSSRGGFPSLPPPPPPPPPPSHGRGRPPSPPIRPPGSCGPWDQIRLGTKLRNVDCPETNPVTHPERGEGILAPMSCVQKRSKVIHSSDDDDEEMYDDVGACWSPPLVHTGKDKEDTNTNSLWKQQRREFSYLPPPPYVEAAPPHLEASPPYVEAPPPHLEATPPHVEAAPPHLEAAPPYVEALPPHLEATPPHVEAAPPHLEAAPQFVEAPPPHLEAPPPLLEAAPPHVEAEPPHVEAAPPHVEASPPHVEAPPPPPPPLQASRRPSRDAKTFGRYRGNTLLPGAHRLCDVTSRRDKREETHRGLPRSLSSPHLVLQPITKFTPDMCGEEREERYRFHGHHAGLFQCSVTGLVFGMEGEGELLYKTHHWDHSFLHHTGKRPAGPLYHFSCVTGSAHQLHLPHCDIKYTQQLLQVAHLTKEGHVAFKQPIMITETHVIVNIMGFCKYGLIKDKEALMEPIKAMVHLLHHDPDDDKSTIHVLMRPIQVPLEEVISKRRNLYCVKEVLIPVVPYCELTPDHKYRLTVHPEHPVQPKTQVSPFREDYINVFASNFVVRLKDKDEDLDIMLSEVKRDPAAQYREPVWECSSIRPHCGVEEPQITQTRGLTLSPTYMKAFVLNNRAELIQRVRNVMPIADDLIQKKFLHNEKFSKIREAKPSQEQMRILFEAVQPQGTRAISAFYDALHKHEPCLVNDLDDGGGCTGGGTAAAGKKGVGEAVEQDGGICGGPVAPPQKQEKKKRKLKLGCKFKTIC